MRTSMYLDAENANLYAHNFALLCLAALGEGGQMTSVVHVRSANRPAWKADDRRFAADVRAAEERILRVELCAAGCRRIPSRKAVLRVTRHRPQRPVCVPAFATSSPARAPQASIRQARSCHRSARSWSGGRSLPLPPAKSLTNRRRICREEGTWGHISTRGPPAGPAPVTGESAPGTATSRGAGRPTDHLACSQDPAHGSVGSDAGNGFAALDVRAE